MCIFTFKHRNYRLPYTATKSNFNKINTSTTLDLDTIYDLVSYTNLMAICPFEDWKKSVKGIVGKIRVLNYLPILLFLLIIFLSQ